jgi:hypothetical protein
MYARESPTSRSSPMSARLWTITVEVAPSASVNGPVSER